MGKHIRAQIAIEFIFLVCVAFVMLLIFLKVVGDQADELNEKKEFILVKDLAYKIQYEINMATQVKSGYNRTFFIPEKLDNKDYTITKTENKITVGLKNSEFTITIPEINGNINKSNNTIINIGGVIYLN
ncbi:MAG: hypothetical protein KKA61_02780 [Nanoarchaeota archaeon]|nr:hypothetical protein [Nanoarchaeota archaeon]MBU4493271.1 hypothetical protein [Nanoarchaeota archaeon]